MGVAVLNNFVTLLLGYRLGIQENELHQSGPSIRGGSEPLVFLIDGGPMKVSREFSVFVTWSLASTLLSASGALASDLQVASTSALSTNAAAPAAAAAATAS